MARASRSSSTDLSLIVLLAKSTLLLQRCCQPPIMPLQLLLSPPPALDAAGNRVGVGASRRLRHVRDFKIRDVGGVVQPVLPGVTDKNAWVSFQWNDIEAMP